PAVDRALMPFKGYAQRSRTGAQLLLAKTDNRSKHAMPDAWKDVVEQYQCGQTKAQVAPLKPTALANAIQDMPKTEKISPDSDLWRNLYTALLKTQSTVSAPRVNLDWMRIFRHVDRAGLASHQIDLYTCHALRDLVLHAKV